MVRSSGTRRVLEARLPGEFTHRPCALEQDTPFGVRRACPPPSSDSPDVEAARVEFARVLAVPKSDRDHLASAIWDLIWFRVKPDLAPTITKLRGLASASNGPDAANTLGVALIVRGRRSGRAFDLFAALDLYEGLTSRYPDDARVAFNHALVLEELALHERAATAWRLAAVRSVEPGWAQEAIERALAAETQAAVEGEANRDPAVIFDQTIEFLIEEWIADPRAGDATVIAAARHRLDATLSRSGAQASASLIEHELALWIAASPARKRDLAAGYLALVRARSALSSLESAAALESVLESERYLAGVSSGLLEVARLAHAHARYRGADMDRSLTLLSELRSGGGSDIIRARAASLAGLIYALRGQFAGATQSFGEAVQRAVAARSPRLQAEMRQGLVDVQRATGNIGAVWEGLYELARRADAVAPDRAVGADMLIARQLDSADLRRAAMVFSDRAAASAIAVANPAVAFYALLERGRLLGLAGRSGEGMGDVVAARRRLEGFPRDARLQLSSDVDVVEAALVAQTEPRRALELVEAAARQDDRSGSTVRLAERQLAAANAHIAQGNDGQAATALRIGLRGLRDQVAAAGSPGARAGLVRQARVLTDRLVRLMLEAGADSLEMLRVVEAHRELSAPRLIALGRPALVDRLLDGPLVMRSGTVVVAYWVLDAGSVAWVLGSGDLRVVRLEPGRAQLRSKFAEFRAAVEARDESRISLVGAEIHRWLVGSVEALTAGAANLTFVLDDAMHSLPMGVLASGGEPLGSRYELSVASNVMSAVAHGQSESGLPPPRSVLAFAGTALSVPDLRTLGALPQAGAEVVEVRASYGAGTALVAERATRTAWDTEFARHDLIHFAGHAIHASAEMPVARLVLSGGATVTAAEIAAEELDPRTIVVLSACHGAEGTAVGEQGIAGLVPAFQAAGAAAIVASPWRVPDEAVGALVGRFHAYLSIDGDPVRALARAQREAVRAGAMAPWEAFAFSVHLGDGLRVSPQTQPGGFN